MQAQGLRRKETKGNTRGNAKVFSGFHSYSYHEKSPSGSGFKLFMFYFTAAIPLNHGNIPERRKDNLRDSSFSGRRVKRCFQRSCSQNPALFSPILSIDALGKLNINNSFLPRQVGRRVKLKWSWHLTFIHLHPIKRNSRLLASRCPLQREKVWKIIKKKKSLGATKMSGLGPTDLPTSGSLPFGEIIHLTSRLAIKKWSGQISSNWRLPSRSFPLHAQTPKQEELLPHLRFFFWAVCGILATSLRCLNQASLALATVVGGHFWLSPPILSGKFTQQLGFTLELLHDGQRVLLWYRVVFRGGKQELRCFSGGGGRNRSFLRRSKEKRGGDWLSARGEQGSSLCLRAVIHDLFSRPIAQFLP